MRWKFINDVAGEKGDTVMEAINFYSNLNFLKQKKFLQQLNH